MSSRVLRRRSATAAWIYVAVACGIVGDRSSPRASSASRSSACSRPRSSAVGFFQTLLDLTVEESLTKYGFRYVAAQDWGRVRRLFRQTLLLKLVGGALATSDPDRSSRRSPMRSSTPTVWSRRSSRLRCSRSCSRPRTSARRLCCCTAATTCAASTRPARPGSDCSPSSSPRPWVSPRRWWRSSSRRRSRRS